MAVKRQQEMKFTYIENVHGMGSVDVDEGSDGDGEGGAGGCADDDGWGDEGAFKSLLDATLALELSCVTLLLATKD